MGRIPKSMQDIDDRIAALLEPYCDTYLDEEYKELCFMALEKLCRKRPSPLLSGRVNTWAASIVYAVGAENFIFDRASDIHFSAAELVKPFGVSPRTAANKASDIRKMLKMDALHIEWIRPSHRENNSNLNSAKMRAMARNGTFRRLFLRYAKLKEAEDRHKGW